MLAVGCREIQVPWIKESGHPGGGMSHQSVGGWADGQVRVGGKVGEWADDVGEQEWVCGQMCR